MSSKRKQTQLTRLNIQNSAVSTSYEYTRGGLLTKVTYPEGSDTYTYNALDLVTDITRSINGFGKKSKHMTYTRAALLSEITLPYDEKLVYTYTQNGKPLTVTGNREYLTSVNYNDYGAPVKYGFAGGFSFNTEYNLLKRVKKLYTCGMKDSAGFVTDRHLTYSYDHAGNILSKDDSSGILTEAYTYDERNRFLTSTALNAPERSFTFEYDDFNNITKMVKNGAVKTYEYDGVKVHSLKSVREGSSYKRYSYNENGDVTLTDSPDVARSIEYDALNRVTGMTVTGADKNRSWNYSYDSDGERIKKSFTDPETGKHMTTVYWFSDYEETFADSTLQKVSKLYGSYAQRVTEYDEAGSVKEEKLDFIFKDILGSPVCTCDENGTVKDNFVYEPFGKMLPNESADSLMRSYTGHFAEDDEGLYYCHARWYDADIGRFLQADTVLDGFNRYAYCHNNPVGFTDPTGLSRQNPDGTYDYSLGGNPHEGEGSAASGKNKDGDKRHGHEIMANPNVKVEFLSFNDMVKLWDINNKKYNYSKSIQGIFGIGQAAFDNSLMVGDALDLFSDIAKDIFDVAGDVSTIVGLVTALMPDPEGEIKQKWDNFLASYVESRGGKIDPDVKDIRMSVYTTHKKEKFCEQRGLRIVSGFRTLTTRTTELDYYNPKTRKNPTVKIKEESWIDY